MRRMRSLLQCIATNVSYKNEINEEIFNDVTVMIQRLGEAGEERYSIDR